MSHGAEINRRSAFTAANPDVGALGQNQVAVTARSSPASMSNGSIVRRTLSRAMAASCSGELT